MSGLYIPTNLISDHSKPWKVPLHIKLLWSLTFIDAGHNSDFILKIWFPWNDIKDVLFIATAVVLSPHLLRSLSSATLTWVFDNSCRGCARILQPLYILWILIANKLLLLKYYFFYLNGMHCIVNITQSYHKDQVEWQVLVFIQSVFMSLYGASFRTDPLITTCVWQVKSILSISLCMCKCSFVCVCLAWHLFSDRH